MPGAFGMRRRWQPDNPDAVARATQADLNAGLKPSLFASIQEQLV